MSPSDAPLDTLLANPGLARMLNRSDSLAARLDTMSTKFAATGVRLDSLLAGINRGVDGPHEARRLRHSQPPPMNSCGLEFFGWARGLTFIRAFSFLVMRRRSINSFARWCRISVR